MAYAFKIMLLLISNIVCMWDVALLKWFNRIHRFIIIDFSWSCISIDFSEGEGVD